MIITTARLVLKPHDGTGYEREVAWLRDAEVVKYSEQRHFVHTLTSQAEYRLSLTAHDEHYQIFLEGQHIGGLVTYYDPFNYTMDMSILIGDRSAWGMGFGKEAWAGMMETAFTTNPKLRKVTAGCMACNTPMIMIAMGTGMLREATIPQHFWLHDHPVDKIMFGKIR